MRTHRRGMTMLEVMFTMAVLTTGMLGTMAVVSETVKYNRRSSSGTQAQTIADRVLEEISSRGCQPIFGMGSDACGNVKALDQTSRDFYWSIDGRLAEKLSTTDYQGLPLQGGQPPPDAKHYIAYVDVDPPFESGESYASAALLNTGGVVNVRVTVVWDDGGGVMQSVALQTRVRP